MVDKEPTNPKKSNSHERKLTSLKRKVVWTALTLTLIGSIYTIVGGNVPNQAFAAVEYIGGEGPPDRLSVACDTADGGNYAIFIESVVWTSSPPKIVESGENGGNARISADIIDSNGDVTPGSEEQVEPSGYEGGTVYRVEMDFSHVESGWNPEVQPLTLRLYADGALIYTYEIPVIDCPPEEGNTPVGSDVTVQPIPELTITFAKVTKLGNTEATILNSNPGPVLPDINFLRFWNIETTAEYEGPIQICWDYSGMASQIHPYVEHTLKLFHLESGSWQDVTKSLDIGSNRLCGEVASFSNFAIGITPMRIEGFYSPVDMNDIVNTVKSGQTVPLKFEVFAGQQEITSTDAIKSFTQGKISCSSISNEPTDVIEVTTTGGTELRYDESSGQYVQNWKTPSKQPNTCWKVTLTTADDSKISAYFKLT